MTAALLERLVGVGVAVLLLLLLLLLSLLSEVEVGVFVPVTGEVARVEVTALRF